MDKAIKAAQNIFQETISTCRYVIKYAIFFGFFINILNLAVPLYSMQVLDRVLSSGNLNTLLMLVIIVAIALIVAVFLQFIRSMAATLMQTWIIEQLFNEVLSLSFAIAVKNSGAVGSEYVRDFDKVKSFLSSNEFINLIDIPWSILFIFVLFSIHPYIGILVLVGLIISTAIAVFTYFVTNKMNEILNKINVERNQFTEQAIRNSEVIVAMQMNQNIYASFAELDTEYIKQFKKTKYYIDLFGQITNFIKLFMSVAVLGLGAILVLNNKITAGAIIASSAIAGRSLLPIHILLQSISKITEFQESYDRLNNAFLYMQLNSQSMKLPDPLGKLEFQGVSYAANKKSKPIVRNISFQLNPGEILAIIGPTGSGKSTIAKLACGVWEASNGFVRIDDANIVHWNEAGAGQFIGYLPQNIQLFKGSVKENIAKMAKDADDKQVIAAAQKTGLHELILKMPMGYDTDIGYDATNLSAGIRQRLGLARAFYNNPKYMILDEPNSNLDIQGEEELEYALRIAKEEKITTIIISHKQPILRLVDKIMIIMNGQVVDIGGRNEIIKKHLVAKKK